MSGLDGSNMARPRSRSRGDSIGVLAHILSCRWSLWLAVLLILLAGGCSTDFQEPSFDNPLDPTSGEGLPVPESVIVTVGDNRIVLSWSLPDGESADEYAVFRKRVDAVPAEDERLLGKVQEPTYTDRSVRNGRLYAYRIAALVAGRYSRRSDEIEASPTLFSILLADDKEVTSSRDVSVSFPFSGASQVRLSEDPGSFTGQWRNAGSSVSWQLSPGDGAKTVYAQFRLDDGSETETVSDSIRLDTRASIQTVEYDGTSVRSPGDAVHFRVVAGEPYGTATITVEGVFSSVALLDDGTGGDPTANDGTYERDLLIPPTANVEEVEVRGEFTDEAGNQAASRTAMQTLSVQRGPEAVTIVQVRASLPPNAPSVKVRWSQYQKDDFARYRLFRSESAGVSSSDELVDTQTSAGTVEYTDTDVWEGQTWYYRVYVENQDDLEAASNVASLAIPNLRPPTAVTLQTPTAMAVDRIAVHWDKSADKDFGHYRLYRNDVGAVTDQDVLVAEVNDPDRTFWDDTALTENTTYYYRLYTEDQGGLVTRSEQVEAKTDNEAPPPVVLREAADVDTTAMTLSWSESLVHDFETYRLYRDTIATVTTGSTLVVDLDDKTFTSFRDEEIERGTRYYYRVFVVDDGDKIAGSNIITATTPDSTGGGTP